MVVPTCSHQQFLQHLRVAARTSQRACVGSIVHKTVSSFVHHLHGSSAPPSISRTNSTQPAAQRDQDQHGRTRNDGCVNSARHQFTQLQQRPEAQHKQQPQHQQRFLTGKEVKIAMFGGNGYHICIDDITAVLGTRQVSIARAFAWAEQTAKPCLRASWCTLEESRDPSSKGVGAKCRTDTNLERRNQIGATLGALRPTKKTDIKDLLPATAIWEDEIRKDEEITGSPVLNEATKKAIATDGATRVCNTYIAECSQIQHVLLDEVTGGQLCQVEVAEPAQSHKDRPRGTRRR